MKTLLVALSLSLINETPTFAGPPDACQIALDSETSVFASTPDSEYKILDLNSIFEKEHKNSEANIALMSHIVRVLTYESPVSKIQSQVDGYYRNKKIITSTSKFGPLSKWYFTSNVKGMLQSLQFPIQIETAEDAISNIQLLRSDLDKNLENLSDFEKKLFALAKQQHKQIETNLSTAAEITKKLREIEPVKKKLDSVVNLTAMEQSTKNTFYSQISELAHLVPVIKKRTEGLNAQLSSLEQQKNIVSALRNNLVAIKNADVPSLIASLPQALAVKLSLPADSGIATGALHKSILFDRKKYDPVALIEYYMVIKYKGNSDFLKMSDLQDIEIKDTEKLWKVFVEKFKQIRGRRTEYAFFKKSNFAALKVNKKNMLILGINTLNETVEIRKFEELIFTPVNFNQGTQVNTVRHFVNVGDNLILVGLIGFTGAGDFIFEDNDKNLYNEKQLQILTYEPQNLQTIFAFSHDQNTFVELNYLGTDSREQRFYQYRQDSKLVSGPLEKLKNNNLEILAPVQAGNSSASSKIGDYAGHTFYKGEDGKYYFGNAYFAGVNAKGEDIYYYYIIPNNGPKKTIFIKKESLYVSGKKILAPNVYNVKTEDFVSAISTADYYGAQLKSILDRLAEGESLPTSDRTIAVAALDSYRPEEILSQIIKFQGSALTVTLGLLHVTLWDKEGFGKADILPLSNFIIVPSESPTNKYLSTTGRFHFGETFTDKNSATIKVISSFKVGDRPYILCLRSIQKPQWDHELIVLDEETLN